MDSIHTRTTSAFPISIGTSLALETLFDGRQSPYDPDRELPERPDLRDYQEIWINVETLMRNITSAMDKIAFLQSNEREFLDAVLMEMEVINSVFQTEGQGLCLPRYYFSDYKGLEVKDNKVRKRPENSDLQKTFRFRVDEVRKVLDKTTEVVRIFKDDIKPETRTKALLITHFPYDLLSYKNFHTFHLLESHTGILKTRREWNSKYYPLPDKDMSHLPFHRHLLYVFGDRSQIALSPFKLRELIYTISKARNWTPVTTIDKIKMDYGLDIKEHMVRHFLQSLIALGA